MRGEQNTWQEAQTAALGSPPLARGTVAFDVILVSHDGITPACAGNRRSRLPNLAARWDHPRLRGEQFVAKLVSTLAPGSPPLARGTGQYIAVWAARYGITPACAGNRMAARRFQGGDEDHPRLRGEQETTLISAIQYLGSPPLARGTEYEGYKELIGRRITPACAGNRILINCHKLLIRDHPRLRGEQGLEENG